jgi:alkanesulfonate monooxygenase SsuD/methylene tetrahydromethanopterin reductase-like flavin-dependent oxidoreductase (luciferase family)
MAMPVFAPGSISFRLYPHNELAADEIVATLRAQALQAERAGFDGIMTAEHHGGVGGYLPNPLQVAGWALEATERAWAAACPILLPLRPTALVIEEAAWLAARFPGRVGLGVGAGALEADFQIMGQAMEGYKERFLAALPVVTKALTGGDAGLLAKDPAVLRLAQNPVPVLSAASTPGGCRHAAAAGAGLLLDGGPAHIRRIVGIYRDAGGKGPLILVRRVWLGDAATFKKLQERLMAFYSGYVDKDSLARLIADPPIGGTPAEAAEKLAASLHETDTEALNIRVHVPGVSPDEVRAQINALAETIRILRRT